MDEGMVEIEDEDGKDAAAEAKARGTALFAKGRDESYREAILAYEEAEKHDPTDHVFSSNICACYLELIKSEWEPSKKINTAARAFIAAQRCAALKPGWVKAHLRKATAEAELLIAVTKWKERVADRKEPLDYDGKAWPEPDPSFKTTFESASHSSCISSCRAGLALERGNAALRLRLQLLRDEGHTDSDEAADRALVDVDAAAPLKAEGNAAFSSKKYADAAEKYTAALSFNPHDHIFYSNRSACYAGLQEEREYPKALRDADCCLRLKADFAKGHSRRSAALFGLGRYVDSEAAATAGLALDSESSALKDLLAAAKVETAETVEVQAQMHKMRTDRASNEKMKAMLSGLNLGGMGGVKVMQPGGGMGGMESLFGGGGMGGMGGMGAPAQTDDQMRSMARAMSQAGGGGQGGKSVDVE